MKRYQKLVAMAMAAVLCLGIFAGCSGGSSVSAKNGLLMTTVKGLREEKSLEPLEYSAELSQKAETIIQVFKTNEQKIEADTDGNSTLKNGEAFREVCQQVGVGTEDSPYAEIGFDGGEDGSPAVLFLWIPDEAEDTKQVVITDIIGPNGQDMTNPLMSEQAIKVGFASCHFEGRTHWIALVEMSE